MTDTAPASARRPVHGSTATRSTSAGTVKSLISQPLDASWRKPRQTYVVTSMEKSGSLGVETSELSELPFQAPTASAYSPASRPPAVGAAR